MSPSPSNPSFSELLRRPLMEMLQPKHSLVKFADVIDWPAKERPSGAHFASPRRRVAQMEFASDPLKSGSTGGMNQMSLSPPNVDGKAFRRWTAWPGPREISLR